MNQIFDIISQWNGIGQWVFLLIIFLTLVGFVGNMFKYIAVCLRGWPTYELKDDE